jgi:uncharacterized membrane protein YdjX (TVP38/TMEM64 family)
LKKQKAIQKNIQIYKIFTLGEGEFIMSPFSFKYPRLSVLAISVLVAGIILYEGTHCASLHDFLLSLGFWGTLLAGIFYVYGFTAAPASAVLLILGNEQSLWYSGIVGSIGSWLGDIILYLFVKEIFMGEIKQLSNLTFFTWIGKTTPRKLYNIGIYVLSGIFIASPLPTEIGIILLSSQKKIPFNKFILSIMLFHTIGVFVMLWIGSKI